MEILEKIEKLRETYKDPSDTSTISAWEEEAKKLLLVQGIAGSDAVQYLIKEMQEEVERANNMLLNVTSGACPDTYRDVLIAKRDIWQRVISYFDVDTKLQSLEKEIENN
jgi:pyruvate/2-oxoacid:ferredoxin oxidoreductase alpha subunit